MLVPISQFVVTSSVVITVLSSIMGVCHLVLFKSVDQFVIYSMNEGESVSRSQRNIKRKTYDFRTWKDINFSTYPSTNIDTPVPSLYQCVETRSIEVFCDLSQPLPHLYFNLHFIRETFATEMGALYAANTSQNKQETFLYKYPLYWAPFAHAKRTTERWSSVWYPQARSPFWLQKPASKHAHVRQRFFFTRNLSGGKGRPAHKADNLTAICEPIF
jgi:hypothetical protein